MLETLRRGATGWVAKILLGLLVLSFAIWGVADVFTGYRQGSLAVVGDREISAEEFQRAVQLELELISRRIGRRPTLEQARTFGLDAQVLSRLLGSAAVEIHARDLGLGLSEQAVVDAMRRDPTLRGPDGRFSREALDNLARELGVSEKGLVQLRRRDELREQLTDALTAGTVVPDVLLKALHSYREETRTADHFTIDPSVAVKLPEPDPAKLRETYESDKQRFVTPEYRRLAILRLTMEEVTSRAAVSEAEIAAAYEHDKARYAVPERRRVLQLTFKDRDTAEKTAAAITSGKSFEDAAREAGIDEKDYTLGLLQRSDLIDPKVAEAAFTLPAGGTSGVVEGRFGPVLLKVAEIVPGKQRTLEEVRSEVRERLATDRAAPELQRLHDEVDDGRFAGKPLKEIAAATKLQFAEVAATDRTGKAPDGAAALEGPDAQRILATAFQGQVGADNESVELSDGGYAWVDVVAVIEAKQRTFQEAEADVQALWRERETRRQLVELAGRLAERASRGESMEKLAAEVGGRVETARAFKRIGGAPGLPDPAVTQAFVTPKGGAASAETRDGASRVVFRVTDIVPAPEPTSEELATLRASVTRQMEGDAIASYVTALESRLGISINQAVYRRAIGADRQQ